MSGPSRASRLRSGIPWLVFGLALVLATEPVWRILLLGIHPTLDDLLGLRCFGLPR